MPMRAPHLVLATSLSCAACSPGFFAPMGGIWPTDSGDPDSGIPGMDTDDSNHDTQDDTDGDGDGYGSETDCDDDDPSIHPGASDILADDIDQDCSGSDAGLDEVGVVIDELDEISTPTGNLTGEKPQSKIWWHADAWWCVLPDDDGTWIRKLEDESWQRQLEIASGSEYRADVLRDDDLAHILLHDRDSHARLATAVYNDATEAYEEWDERSSLAQITHSEGSEIATLTLDSQERLWVSWTEDDELWASWADSPYEDWTRLDEPLATKLDGDDISLDDTAEMEAIPVDQFEEDSQLAVAPPPDLEEPEEPEAPDEPITGRPGHFYRDVLAKLHEQQRAKQPHRDSDNPSVPQ